MGVSRKSPNAVPWEIMSDINSVVECLHTPDSGQDTKKEAYLIITEKSNNYATWIEVHFSGFPHIISVKDVVRGSILIH